MIKCVVTDLDGTLLMNDQLTEGNRRGLQMLIDNGISVVFATGRSLPEVWLMDEFDSEAILLNGAICVDDNGNEYGEALITEELLSQLMNIVRHSAVGMIIYTDQGIYSVNRRQAEEGFEAGLVSYVASFPEGTEPFYMDTTEIEDSHELAGLKVFKCEVMDVTRQEEVERVRAMIRQIPGIAATTSVSGNIEINAAEANKMDAVRKIMQRKKLSADEIAVFGDGQNDLVMYENLTETYAVENAIEEIRKLAKYQVASCVDDGFLQGVRNIIAQNKSTNCAEVRNNLRQLSE